MELMTQRLSIDDIPIKTESSEQTSFVRKFYDTEQKGVNDGERSVTSYITTLAMDRDGEVVLPQGAQLGDYRKNPVVLALHNYRSLPIGKNLWIKKDAKGLIGKTQYAKHEQADLFFNYRRDGFPMAQSIGFIPQEVIDGDSANYQETVDQWKADHKNAFGKKPKREPRRFYSKWLLLEYSDVPVPSNPDALTLAVGKGYGPIIDTELLLKRVIPYSVHGDSPKAPEDTAWAAGAQVREAEISDLRIMCTWYDAENSDIKGSYKLPHHMAAGRHAVVWNGVRAAMGALFGARGGVQIPSGDRRGVYNHLAKHYRQFEKDPPEFRELGDYSEEDLKMFFDLHEKYGDEYEFVTQEDFARDKLKRIGIVEDIDDVVTEIEEIEKEFEGAVDLKEELESEKNLELDEIVIEPDEIEIDEEPEINLEEIEAPEPDEIGDDQVKEIAVVLGQSIKEMQNELKRVIKDEVRIQLDLMRGKIS